MYVFTLLFLFKSNKFDSLKLELYVCMPLPNHWFYCKMNTKWQLIYLSSDQVTWFKLTTKQLQFTPLFFLNYWRFSYDISPHVHVLVCLHFERWCTACQEYILTSQYFPIDHGHFRPNLSPASEKTTNHYRKAHQTGTDLPQYFHFLLLYCWFHL
jgi:hypothetical protein